MKGFKAFEKGLICRGKQYAENTIFEEESAEICKSGMHFCKNPFEVLRYYSFVNDNAELNEFAEVESLDEAKTDDGEKFTTKKLKIGAKINIAGLAKAFVEYTTANIDFENAAATNTGDRSAATVKGKESFAIATGIEGKARGALGCYIAVAEWKYENEKYNLVGFKTHIVDGKTIKENTFYSLVNGEFKEVE